MPWNHTHYLEQIALNKLGADPKLTEDGLDGPKTQRAKALHLRGLNKTSSSKFEFFQHFTPNKGGTIKPEGICFHHSGGSFAGSLDWCKRGESRVSYNLIIDLNGDRHQLVPFNRRAWHAGRSVFKGRSGCNGFLIGIAFSGDTNERELTPEEIASAVELVDQLRQLYGIPLDMITDHRTVAPGRKDDLHPTQFEKLLRHISTLY